MFDAVSLAFFEIVGKISLGRFLLLVQVGRQGFINLLQAGLEGLAVAVDGLYLRIQGLPVGGDFLLYLGAKSGQWSKMGSTFCWIKKGLVASSPACRPSSRPLICFSKR